MYINYHTIFESHPLTLLIGKWKKYFAKILKNQGTKKPPALNVGEKKVTTYFEDINYILGVVTHGSLKL